MAADFERECFFIAPIGDKGSDIRKRSDGVRDYVVKPAAKANELKTLRADDVGEPGQITSQAVQHCLKAKAAVADLTGGNPNVYYELSIRHGAQLPVVLIAEEGTNLPFDISQSRVIFFDHTDLASASKAKDELETQIAASLTGVPDNPISDGMRLAELQGGNVEEQTLAHLVRRVESMAHAVDNIDARTRRVERREEIRRSVQASRREIPPEVRQQMIEEMTRREELGEIQAEEDEVAAFTEEEQRTLEQHQREADRRRDDRQFPAD